MTEEQKRAVAVLINCLLATAEKAGMNERCIIDIFDAAEVLGITHADINAAINASFIKFARMH